MEVDIKTREITVRDPVEKLNTELYMILDSKPIWPIYKVTKRTYLVRKFKQFYREQTKREVLKLVIENSEIWHGLGGVNIGLDVV